MKWFVNNAFSYSPVNEKAKELGKWVDSFKHTLLPDDLSKDAFIEEARMILVFLNKNILKRNRFPLIVLMSIEVVVSDYH